MKFDCQKVSKTLANVDGMLTEGELCLSGYLMNAVLCNLLI
jgi:hypothetical protein